jgi:hypothetical protein
MKISVGTAEALGPWAIYFNGQRMELCTEADDVEGYVIAYFTIRGAPVLEKRHGTVRILWEGNLLVGAP